MHYKPSYLPHNAVARDLVQSIAEQIGLALNQKHEIVLASFLATAKARDSAPFDWMVGNENKDIKFYSHYPNVGVKVINKVRGLLMEHGLLSDTTKRKTELLEQQIMESFGVTPSEFELMTGVKQPVINPISEVTAMVKGLDDAIFVEANLPLVQVNEAETWEDRLQRKSQDEKRQRMGITKVKSTFRSEYSKAVRPLKEMNAYWQQHPLYNPIQKEYYAAATRIFHNASIKSGGRWYGGWVNKEYITAEQRLDFTIDEEPVCEIDLNASLPTLLSCLVSKPMLIGETWTDAYQCLVDQLPNIENARDKVKQVFVELIGTGNPNKRQPSMQNKDNCLDSVEEFILIRDLALKMYPALNDLNKKHMNFTDALSFHEANILTNTLLQLKKQGVVAYPIHDCVMVKEKHQSIAVKTFRSEFSKYVSTYQSDNNLSYVTIKIAVSVESKTKPKVRMQGRYLLDQCATGMRNTM